MTLALDPANYELQLNDSVHSMRRVIANAGYGVPAAALHDHRLAEWARSQGITVTAYESELDLVHRSGIRPTQVLFRCGESTDAIRRAVNMGVVRFVVSTSVQITGLGLCAQRTKFLYLDERSPLVAGNHRLKVVAISSDVDECADPCDWAAAAERLLCRTAVMNSCGLPVGRIMLSGGSFDVWSGSSGLHLTSIVKAVDDALREGCERWLLPRPAVSLVPSIA